MIFFSFRAILLTVCGGESNIAYNSWSAAHALYPYSTVVRLCKGENHQRLLNKAIPQNNLILLFPLPMYVRSAKFMERLKGDQAIHQTDEKSEQTGISQC